jgi:hypothetical protein
MQVIHNRALGMELAPKVSHPWLQLPKLEFKSITGLLHRPPEMVPVNRLAVSLSEHGPR